MVPVGFVRILFGEYGCRALAWCLVGWLLMLFLEEERLPFKEGWRTPKNETNFQSLMFILSIMAKILEDKMPNVVGKVGDGKHSENQGPLI